MHGRILPAKVRDVSAARLGALSFSAVAALLLSTSITLALEQLNANIAQASAHTMALADRMIVSGGLLILFVVLAATSLAMWRDLGRRARRI